MLTLVTEGGRHRRRVCVRVCVCVCVGVCVCVWKCGCAQSIEKVFPGSAFCSLLFLFIVFIDISFSSLVLW